MNKRRDSKSECDLQAELAELADVRPNAGDDEDLDFGLSRSASDGCLESPDATQGEAPFVTPAGDDNVNVEPTARTPDDAVTTENVAANCEADAVVSVASGDVVASGDDLVGARASSSVLPCAETGTIRCILGEDGGDEDWSVAAAPAAPEIFDVSQCCEPVAAAVETSSNHASCVLPEVASLESGTTAVTTNDAPVSLESAGCESASPADVSPLEVCQPHVEPTTACDMACAPPASATEATASNGETPADGTPSNFVPERATCRFDQAPTGRAVEAAGRGGLPRLFGPKKTPSAGASAIGPATSTADSSSNVPAKPVVAAASTSRPSAAKSSSGDAGSRRPVEDNSPLDLGIAPGDSNFEVDEPADASADGPAEVAAANTPFVKNLWGMIRQKISSRKRD